jgi:hypothetical protein
MDLAWSTKLNWKYTETNNSKYVTRSERKIAKYATVSLVVFVCRHLAEYSYVSELRQVTVCWAWSLERSNNKWLQEQRRWKAIDYMTVIFVMLSGI